MNRYAFQHASLSRTCLPIPPHPLGCIIHPMQEDIYKSDYDYNLPEDLIAKYPPSLRTDSKLLALKKNECLIYKFSEIIDLLDPSDILVLNETKVNPARLKLTKNTGGKIEILILESLNKFSAKCLTRGLNKKLKKQTIFAPNFPINIIIKKDYGDTVEIEFDQSINHLCEAIGNMPIPPYLNRPSEDIDKERYQSVFANKNFQNSVAAPTASLHFDENLLENISKRIHICKLNLNVGLGTFKPLSNDPINSSTKLHLEKFHIPEQTADCINQGIKDGRRIIALGTTTLRALEAAWCNNKNLLRSGNMATDIFIFEGFKFNVVNTLITNFHLPQSSLLMLVSAFGGKDKILNAYQYAIKHKLRFFSYGDAMIIER